MTREHKERKKGRKKERKVGESISAFEISPGDRWSRRKVVDTFSVRSRACPLRDESEEEREPENEREREGERGRESEEGRTA